MTTSYIPEPRPGDPATPASNPAIEPNTPPPSRAERDTAGNADAPAEDKSADAATDSDRPRDEATGPALSDTSGHAEHPDSPATATDGTGDAGELADTYTTTEPGFPIGELIAAIAQPGISAAMMLPSLAMALPSTAMGFAGPLLASLVALLGQAGQQPPSAGRQAPPPPPRSNPAVKNSQGSGPDAYRDAAKKTEEDEAEVRDHDAKTDDVVARGNAVQAQARNDIKTIAADLELAARRTPPGPDGAAALNQHIREGLHSARAVVLRAQSDYQQLAGTLVRP